MAAEARPRQAWPEPRTVADTAPCIAPRLETVHPLANPIRSHRRPSVIPLRPIRRQRRRTGLQSTGLQPMRRNAIPEPAAAARVRPDLLDRGAP